MQKIIPQNKNIIFEKYFSSNFLLINNENTIQLQFKQP